MEAEYLCIFICNFVPKKVTLMKRIIFFPIQVCLLTAFFCLLCLSPGIQAQGVKPLPSIHVDGKWLVDKHGNHVVLHGVMDTPNMYFNGWRWGSPWDTNNYADYNNDGMKKCLAYFEKIFTGLETAKCNLFRLHLDPVWSNSPVSGYQYEGAKDQPADVTGEADISKFYPNRLKRALPSFFLKLAEMAMNHGMYVVEVGDYYQAYLMTVWDIFSQQNFVLEHPGQISIELANEPVNLKNAQNNADARAMHDYFQPIVDKIRENGFTGIIWAPGTGWQSNYRNYKIFPIEGDNIGYAVHDYTGWYGCSDESVDKDKDIERSKQKKITEFHNSVPVVDFAPVIITEVDWSPKKPGAGHYNEHGDWVEPNYGTWSTGSTSKWGVCYKAMLDYFGNISMTLSGTGCLIDIDQLLEDGSVVPAFEGVEEACGKACMDWYAEYYNVNWPHADDETGILSPLTPHSSPLNVYDLQGRRVTDPLKKGIYIVDGKLKIKH